MNSNVCNPKLAKNMINKIFRALQIDVLIDLSLIEPSLCYGINTYNAQGILSLQIKFKKKHTIQKNIT